MLFRSINLKKLYEFVAQATEELFPERYESVVSALEIDYAESKLKSTFDSLKLVNEQVKTSLKEGRVNRRQQRH